MSKSSLNREFSKMSMTAEYAKSPEKVNAPGSPGARFGMIVRGLRLRQ